MQTTYHLKGKEVNDTFLNTIRKLFRDDENITITIAIEKKENEGQTLMKKHAELEKKYLPKQVDKDFDFNAVVDTRINF